VVFGIVPLIPIEDSVRGLLVLIVNLLRRAVHREGRWSTLRIRCAIDAVRAVEERNSSATEVESLGKRRIRDVRAPLRLKNVECREARAPDIVVAHASIL
jgi:hypothetical protein